MKCFALIKSVLDEQYDAIPGSTTKKDGKIREQLDYLSDQYGKLAVGVNVDYRNPATRFAYIYKYVTSHANMVYSLIHLEPALRTCFKRDKISVSCVGGGPGSEFIGVVKYMAGLADPPQLMCHMLDREKTWNECWADVDDKVNADMRVSTNFMQLDVTEPASWDGFNKYLRVDLFTMVYFLSEVYSRKSEAKSFMRNLFSKASDGSLILFVDNRDKRFYEWFDDLAETHNFEFLRSDETILQLPIQEEKRDLGDYLDKFGSPKLQSSVAYRVVRKMGDGDQ